MLANVGPVWYTTSMKTKMMKCGCAANGKCGDKDICVAHYSLTPDGAIEVPAPDLSKRHAVCCYGQHGKIFSSVDLAFFEYRPNENFDRYYCGCYGWD